MKINKWALLMAGSLMFAGGARADDFKNNFQANLNSAALDALAKDVGAIVGGGAFHTGKALGFPLGIDVGVHVPVARIDSENTILHDDRSSWGAVFGQVEIGLPAKFNVIGRVGTLGDGKILGGGLRYGILKPSLPGLPSLSIQGLYDAMDHDYFDLKHYSADAVLSFDFPIVHPYLGAGYDHTTLDATSEAYVGAPGSATANASGSASGYRVEGGVNLSLIPFTYVSLGAGVANGGPLYHVGAGVSF